MWDELEVLSAEFMDDGALVVVVEEIEDAGEMVIASWRLELTPLTPGAPCC